MLFRFLVIPELVLTLETFLTDFTIKLFVDIFLFIVIAKVFLRAHILVLFFEILLNFFEPFLLQFLLDVLHLLLFDLLLFFSLQFLLHFLLLFLLQSHLIVPKTRVPFFYICYEIFYSFDVILLFALTLLLILLLHLSSHPSVSCLSRIPLLAPYESLVGRKVLPIFVKFDHPFFRSRRVSKALIFSEFLFDVFSKVVSLSLFCFDFFEDVTIDGIEPLRIIPETFEAVHGKVVPNVEAKAILF